MPTIKDCTLENFKQDIIDRAFPRQLILSRNTSAFNRVVRDALKELNKLLFQVRYFEFPISGNKVDLSTLDVKGIEVDEVSNVIPATDYYTLFENYKILIGRPFFTFNILRRQDDFIDFILSTEFHKQMMNRYRNFSLNYEKFGNTLLLGENFETAGIGKVLVEFLPRIKIDNSTIEWELYDLEEQFVNDYLEGLVYYREGRSQSEMTVMNMDTNADTLMSEGKDIMESVKEEFRRLGFARIGKKF